MSIAGINLLQKMNHNNVITLSDVEYTVVITLDGTTYLRNADRVVHEAYSIEDTDGIYGVRSWTKSMTVHDENESPIRFILMGNLIEEITGQKM